MSSAEECLGKAKEFAQNSFWLGVSTGSVMLIGAVYRPLIGRFLGPTGYGEYSFIQVFAGYFLVIAYFGIRSVVAREIGRDPRIAEEYTLAAVRIRAITSVVALILCCAIGYLLRRSGLVTLGIFVYSLSILAVAAGDLLEGVLVAFHRSFYVAISNLVGNLLKLGIGLWALKSGYGLLGVLWVYVFTSAITAIMNAWFVRAVFGQTKQNKAESSPVKYVLIEALPFLALFVSGSLYAKNDILFLTFFRGEEVTGLYSAAYVFVDLLLGIGVAITTAAYPMIARIHGEEEGKPDGDALIRAYERLHKHMLMVFAPVSILLMSLGVEALSLVFGREYLPGYQAMRILVWAPVVEVSCLVSGNFLSGTYRQRLEARIAVTMTALNIAWTVSFIILFGAIGAAVATVGASAVNAVVRYIYVNRTIGRIRVLSAWVKPLACAAVMLIAVQLAADMTWAWRLIIALAGYAIAIAVIRPYDLEDKRLVLSLFRR
jgi:O-antigen/teichoic acid export membrane protein